MYTVPPRPTGQVTTAHPTTPPYFTYFTGRYTTYIPHTLRHYIVLYNWPAIYLHSTLLLSEKNKSWPPHVAAPGQTLNLPLGDTPAWCKTRHMRRGYKQKFRPAAPLGLLVCREDGDSSHQPDTKNRGLVPNLISSISTALCINTFNFRVVIEINFAFCCKLFYDGGFV